MSDSKEKWDHKHGLAKRGEDFTADSGSTHGAGSLAIKQVRDRIFELFGGKPTDSVEKRLMALPTHIDQLQNLLRNMVSGVGTATIKQTEAQLRADLNTRLRSVSGIDVPPIGIVFPASAILLILWKYNNVETLHERYLGAQGVDQAYRAWTLSGNQLGDFHKSYGLYKAWPYYKNMASPTVTQADAHYTLVGNFFGNGLQWDSWSLPG